MPLKVLSFCNLSWMTFTASSTGTLVNKEHTTKRRQDFHIHAGIGETVVDVFSSMTDPLHASSDELLTLTSVATHPMGIVGVVLIQWQPQAL